MNGMPFVLVGGALIGWLLATRLVEWDEVAVTALTIAAVWLAWIKWKDDE